MGDANSILTAAETRHLLKRTGFGAAAKDVAKSQQKGNTRGRAVDALLKFNPKKFQPGGKGKDPSLQDSHDQWITYMLKSKFPLQEKLVLFWHDHFATSNVKVANTRLMAEQNLLLRLMCKGNFKDLVKAMNKNAAMMEFLDIVRSGRHQPNENYARELQELFTLGVLDHAGNPNYLQDDIVQIARAFSGWRYDDKKKDTAFLDSDHHDFIADFPERGPKTIYAVRGGFGASGRSFAAGGEGAAEIDTVIDIIFDHTDTDGKNTVARRMAGRLLEYFAHASPDIGVIDEVVATSGFNTNWDIAGLVRTILVHDAFYETDVTPPFTAQSQKSITWPVDFVVSTMRALNVAGGGKHGDALRIDGGANIRDRLTDMGQSLFEPPSVFGWDWETSWISSATLLARFAFARDVIGARVKGKSGFHPEKLISLALSAPGAIVDAVTDLLGITDQLTVDERQALIDYVSDNGANTVIDLTDPDVQNVKLHGLFALVLTAPAYHTH
ncbi:MAG TPA: DUF1800 family protein [Candidatus Binatia bacterium]|jgi:uncharacterized protein (DUF1800 family)